MCFNPRAPYGARHMAFFKTAIDWVFQPTRPVRGAARQKVEKQTGEKFQPTRPVRGAAGSAGARL